MRRRELADFKIRSRTCNTKSKKGKSTSIDNIPSEIIINGGSQMVITMTLLSRKYGLRKNDPMNRHNF